MIERAALTTVGLWRSPNPLASLGDGHEFGDSVNDLSIQRLRNATEGSLRPVHLSSQGFAKAQRRSVGDDASARLQVLF